MECFVHGTEALGSMSWDSSQPIESAEVNVKLLWWVCIHLTPHPAGCLILLSCAASYSELCQRKQLWIRTVSPKKGIWFLEIHPQSRNLCLRRSVGRQLLYNFCQVLQYYTSFQSELLQTRICSLSRNVTVCRLRGGKFLVFIIMFFVYGEFQRLPVNFCEEWSWLS